MSWNSCLCTSTDLQLKRQSLKSARKCLLLRHLNERRRPTFTIELAPSSKSEGRRRRKQNDVASRSEFENTELQGGLLGFKNPIFILGPAPRPIILVGASKAARQNLKLTSFFVPVYLLLITVLYVDANPGPKRVRLRGGTCTVLYVDVNPGPKTVRLRGAMLEASLA